MGGGSEAVLGEMRKEPLQSSGLQNGAAREEGRRIVMR